MIYPGTLFGPYYINREIGRGGMAIVYHAVDEQSGAEVALKVLPALNVNNATLLRRFQQEAAIAQRLRHPNIVRALSNGEIDGYHYIALEYATQGTLSELIERHKEPLSLTECLQILRRVALALDYAHSRGVLHRDMKPSNVLLGPNGQVWLSDFGIARHLDENYTSLTLTSQTIGTPAFMSPEQVQHEREIDGRSDIYSLGVVTYYMLSGGMPFEGNSTLLHKIAYEPPTPPQKFNANLAQGTCFALEKVLSKNPDARYVTASTFIDALQDSETWKPSKQEWAEMRMEGAVQAENGEDPPSQVIVASQPKRFRMPMMGILISLFMCLLLGIGAFAFWSFRDTGNNATPEASILITPTVTATATATAIATATEQVAMQPPEPMQATAAQMDSETPMHIPVPIEAVTKQEPTSTPGPDDTETQLSSALVSITATTDADAANPMMDVAEANSGLRSTSTPVPDNTHTPAPTETPTNTVTATPTKTVASQQSTSSAPNSEAGISTNSAAISVELVEPTNNDTVQGRRTFKWQFVGTLPEGIVFEPVFWKEGQNPIVDGRGWGGSTRATELSIDLTKYSATFGNTKWGVRLWNTNTNTPIRLVSEERRIVVQLPGGGNNMPSPLQLPTARP